MRRFALAVAILALAGAAPGETPGGGATTPGATTLAAARDFLRVADITGQMHALGPSMAQAMATQMRQQFVDSKVPDGLAAQFTAAMQAFIGSLDSAFTPPVIDQLADIYARHFSESDLRHLTTLLGDPAMLRYRAEMPNLLPDMMPVLVTALKPQQETLRARMQQTVVDWIAQHPEDKAKLAHPIAS